MSNMAPEQGGYRQPNNPAPFSGPGALSQRTDGGATEGMSQPQQQYTGMAYGENKNINDQQSQAPLAGNPIGKITPLSAPTLTPHIPLSHGVDSGPGAGSEVMRGLLPNQVPPVQNTLKTLMQYDVSGDAELMYRMLSDNGTI